MLLCALCLWIRNAVLMRISRASLCRAPRASGKETGREFASTRRRDNRASPRRRGSNAVQENALALWFGLPPGAQRSQYLQKQRPRQRGPSPGYPANLADLQFLLEPREQTDCKCPPCHPSTRFRNSVVHERIPESCHLKFGTKAPQLRLRSA